MVRLPRVASVPPVLSTDWLRMVMELPVDKVPPRLSSSPALICNTPAISTVPSVLFSASPRASSSAPPDEISDPPLLSMPAPFTRNAS